METTINQNYIVDNYWNMLKGLSDNVKLALISKLSSSIVARQEVKSRSPKLSDFYGIMADTPYPSKDEAREVLLDEAADETEYICSSPQMLNILREGDKEMESSMGTPVKLEDLWN